MGKIVKAVAPYHHKTLLNFKTIPYDEWVRAGGKKAISHYPFRKFHKLAYEQELPTLWKNQKEARLRFVSGYSIRFDTFPDYAFYEIIPVIWDCWPAQVESVASFFHKHNVKTAVFTSSQTANKFKDLFPRMNILHITEGADLNLYSKGSVLEKRTIDILEVGRMNANFFKTPLPDNVNHVKTGNFSRAFKTDDEFRAAMSDTKIAINVPRCDVDKQVAGDIETLTQRYWECMLSRVLMVGRAPKELTNLIGYNPVIEWDGHDATPLAAGILNHIKDYQGLVEKNYETATRMASWSIRIKQIMDYLLEKGYKI